MFQNVLGLALHHKFVSGFIAVAIIVGGYFGYGALFGNKNAVRYVTATVEKGTLVVSVSGSGQVSAADQVDVKPKVAGDVVWVGVKAGQEVRQWQAILSLDDTDVQKEIADAEWNFNEAKENYDDVVTSAERTLATAYENGYNTVSTIFFKLSDYVSDLRDVLGTGQDLEKYVSVYKIILGSESLFIKKLLGDYNSAFNLFNEEFAFFRGVDKEGERNVIYQLIDDTIGTAKTIGQALESARHVYDAIVVEDYKRVYLASYIDQMKTKIESDVSAVYSNINSLQQIKDTIDNTVKNTPKNIATAQNNLRKQEDALTKLKEEFGNHLVRSPFAGIVAKINVKKGDSVSSGTTLATLITKQKIAEITLNEIDVAQVKVGQKVTLTFDAISDLAIVGQVVEVDMLGSITQGVVTYSVKIAFDTQDERVKPAMSVSAAIIIEAKQDVFLVSNSAVKQQGEAAYVQMASDLRLQPVQTGLANDTVTEVLSGLKEGDVVIAQTISSNSTQTQSRQTTGFSLPGLSSGGQIRQIIR